MLRRDVDEAVVAAAAHTPFEAGYRVFVLERADTMNDEAANALLKTLEEPPDYVVLLLLTDRLTQVLPTIASRCQPVRFDPPLARRAGRSGSRRAAPRPRRPPRPPGSASATASARSRSRPGTAPRCAPARRRSPAHRCTARPGRERPWLPLLEIAASRGAAARAAHEERLAEELQFLPKKEHKQARDGDRRAGAAGRAARADRRARPRPPARGPVVPRPRLRRSPARPSWRTTRIVRTSWPPTPPAASPAAHAGRRPSWSTTRAPGSRST